MKRSLKDILEAIIHCSASNNPDQDSIESVRHLHTSPKTTKIKWGEYDTTGKGWSDVGYHFFIRSCGMIEIGRQMDVVGAHCIGKNKTSIGICLHGRYKEDFTREQKMSLYHLLKSLGIIFPQINVYGHNEFEPKKECPVLDIETFKHI